MASSHLIETNDALFLVDAGFIGHEHTVLRAINRLGRRPEELRLAIVTHAHLDHYGGLAGLRDAAAFEVGSHPDHAEVLQCGGLLVSPSIRSGWDGYVKLAHATMSWLPVRGVGPVRRLSDGDDLTSWGLPGRVVHTPGHSAGCLSLLLDDGTAFVGDLVQGKRLPTLAPELPSMAEDVPAAHASWLKLLDMGAARFLPGHASPFTAEELRATLTRDGVVSAAA